VAARLAAAAAVETTALPGDSMLGAAWPGDLAQVVYIDDFGNLVTGLSSENVNKNSGIRVSGRVLKYAETFCHVPRGQPFWYPNSLGLIEIAANGDSAAIQLSLALGDQILLD